MADMKDEINGLGNCRLCGAALCVVGDDILCISCGVPHDGEGNPTLPANATREIPPDHVIPPSDYGHTMADRVMTLERKVASLEATARSGRKGA